MAGILLGAVLAASVAGVGFLAVRALSHPQDSSYATASMAYCDSDGPRCGWKCHYAEMEPDAQKGAWVCPVCGRELPFEEWEHRKDR